MKTRVGAEMPSFLQNGSESKYSQVLRRVNKPGIAILIGVSSEGPYAPFPDDLGVAFELGTPMTEGKDSLGFSCKRNRSSNNTPVVSLTNSGGHTTNIENLRSTNLKKCTTKARTAALV
jgi:hypothetical protein